MVATKCHIGVLKKGLHSMDKLALIIAVVLLETLEGESESAASAPSDVLQEAPESKEAVHADMPPSVPERPVRGRAAREQLLHDMGGET
jgi:hypothetical protein